MPTPTRARRDPWADALVHLRGNDEHLAAIIERVGPCLLRPKAKNDRFPTLVRSIVSQQISTKAAESINARLLALVGEVYAPEPLIALGADKIRTAGLSGVKAAYVVNLAEAVGSGRVPLHEAHKWDDETVIERLTTIKGIGVWTAEMFLIFALGRPDVLPVADLGVRMGIRSRFGLEEMPSPAQCRALTEAWKPYRTVASWYLWRGKDTSATAGKPK
jgi:DNA-3-methyladenine glycosylase II